MNSREVGICIYCGSGDDLTNEHVMPKALGGELTLLNASCNSCCKITSKFEGDALSLSKSGIPGMLYTLRVMAGLPSRRGSTKNVKLKQILENTRTGKITEVMVDPEDFIHTLMLPIFPEPGCISGNPHPNGLPLNEWMTYLSNKEKAKKGYKYGVKFNSRAGDFPRLLAKIAYCYTIFRLGYEAVKGSPLVEIILNNSPQQSMWIGCDVMGDTISGENKIWAVELGAYKGRMGVKIKLLPEFPKDTPEYVVIIK